jgi:thiol-disulfide isomerase/thioredoxin
MTDYAPFTADRGVIHPSMSSIAHAEHCDVNLKSAKGKKIAFIALGSALFVGLLIGVFVIAAKSRKHKHYGHYDGSDSHEAIDRSRRMDADHGRQHTGRNDMDVDAQQAQQQQGIAPTRRVVIVQQATDASASSGGNGATVIVKKPGLAAHCSETGSCKKVDDLGYAGATASGSKKFTELDSLWETSKDSVASKQQQQQQQQQSSAAKTSAGGPPATLKLIPGQVTYIGTDAELQAILNRKKHAVIAFGQSWCKYCKPLKEAMMDAATQVEDIPFIYVDCANVSVDMHSRFDIKGYPHVIRTNGETHMSCHGRTADELATFATQAI